MPWQVWIGLVVDTDRLQLGATSPGSRSDAELDAMFHALSDTTRRDILRRCLQESPSMSQLASAYPMSFAAVQKHILVLERAGLISRQRRGREQLVSTDVATLHRARQALDKLESDWRTRITRMSGLLEHMSDDTLTQREGNR
jgi:DNA-binding transcriptional ArsR family regulator